MWNQLLLISTYRIQNSNINFNQTQIPIPFDVVKLNAGGAYSASSGKFTSPAKGKYFFTASGIPAFQASSSARQSLDVGLYKNGDLIGSGHADEMTNYISHETFSFQLTLDLQKGDQIWLEIYTITPDTDLWGSGFVHFSGFVLEEEISQSLNSWKCSFGY